MDICAHFHSIFPTLAVKALTYKNEVHPNLDIARSFYYFHFGNLLTPDTTTFLVEDCAPKNLEMTIVLSLRRCPDYVFKRPS